VAQSLSTYRKCYPAVRAHANRPTAYSREASSVAKGITGQIGTFGEFTRETGPKSASNAPQQRISQNDA
jgi:hypothetical protein